MTSKELKKKIMKRVYAIWFFRKVAPAMFLYMPFLTFVALRETAREFFVMRIFDNFLTSVHNAGFSGGLNFVFSALVKIPVLSSLIIVVSLGMFVFILRRLFKNFHEIGLVKSF